MKNIFIILSLSFLYFLPLKASSLEKLNLPGVKSECYTELFPFPWKYCVYKGVEGEGRGLIYHLHGRNLDQHSWGNQDYYTGMLYQSWRDKKILFPTVVSISFGPEWILVEKNSRRTSGLYEFFFKTVLPSIEKKLGVDSPERLLVGESMGGINALQIALKRKKTFLKIASLCPPVAEITPFSSEQETENWRKTTGATKENVEIMKRLGLALAANPEEWKKISPLELVKNFDFVDAPAIYLSCGMYDQYGAFKGVEKLWKAFQEHNAEIIWRPLYGGHCAVDPNSLADFLTLD